MSEERKAMQLPVTREEPEPRVIEAQVTRPEPEHPSLAAKAAAWGVLYDALVEARERRLAAEAAEAEKEAAEQGTTDGAESPE